MTSTNPSSISSPGDSLMWTEKYRPASLNDVISQEVTTNTLKTFLKASRLPHLLFYGPAGTGKTSTIVAIAKELYGANYKSYVLELNASDARGIDVIRNEIKGFASTRRLFDANIKLIILDEADQMTKDAQNALRRVIEQFTKHVRFCLICNYVNKIIPAIQSRCTKFRFAPLKRRAVEKLLTNVAQNENMNITKGAITAIVRLAEGDMRKCLMVLQSVSLLDKDTIDEPDIYQTTGKPTRADMKQIVTSLVQSDFGAARTQVNKLKEEKGLALQDIISGVFTYVSKFTLPLSEDIHEYLLVQLADLEYQLSFGCSEKIQLSALVGVFQIAHKAHLSKEPLVVYRLHADAVRDA
mmetsp:Transcript_9851/g.36737  ORF Transcript_9851/g.36737 Transcript_9851/m.36737 type:complete len:354 (+) Transcript_9851:1-1062(+)